MRWADLDQLGHVNNVRYLHYLIAARREFLSSVLGSDAAGLPVVGHALGYRAPILLSRKPVQIECWVEAREGPMIRLGFEIYGDGRRSEDPRRTFLLGATSVDASGWDESQLEALDEYAESALDPVPPLPMVDQGFVYDVELREADLGPGGAIAESTWIEYLQESRVSMIADIASGKDLPRMFFVVAQIDLAIERQITADTAGCTITSAITMMGSRSMTIHSIFHDPAGAAFGFGRCVVVFTDAETHASAEPHPQVRQVFSDAMD